LDDHVIKYGMSRNYLPDWGFSEALREINQNFMDFGSFDQRVNDVDGDPKLCSVKMINDYLPDDHGFMKIGESGKRGDASAVGKHGEGLKMASMVLLRNDCNVIIRYGSTKLAGMFYDDPYLGECFGYRVYDMDHTLHGFEIEFQVPRNDFIVYREKQLDPEIDVLHSTEYGDVLDRPRGEVYVGGHFVSVVDGLQYAYNFKPEFIELDRDRKVPRDFDVVYTASKILESWDKLKVKDVVAKDAGYMDKVPMRIAKKFKPSMVSGQVVFRSGAIQAPQRVTDKLMEMPVNQNRVAKLKFSLVRKKKPNSILKDFLDKHMHRLTPEGKADAKALLKMSKSWKAG